MYENETGIFSGMQSSIDSYGDVLNGSDGSHMNGQHTQDTQKQQDGQDYGTYQMGTDAVSEEKKHGRKKRRAAKEKHTGARDGRVFGKVMLSVGMGLFFGVFAGIGFYAVQQGDSLLTRLNGGQTASVSGTSATQESDSGIRLTNTESVRVVESDVSAVVEEVMPAMVSIVNNYTESVSSFFGQTYQQAQESSGSGIIVAESEEELLIVSNNHVVSGADELNVTFIDGSQAKANIKGLDSDMDLAVIAVPLESLSAETRSAISIATLGDSDKLKLGEPVIAIGNALGYGQSVTGGYVSALNREISFEDGSTGTFIQTDAAINPGNSGGALLNINGEVIGINSSKIGGSVVEGMGYAIPITSASPIIADLMERQTRTEVAAGDAGYIGISLQEVSEQISAAYNMPVGVYIRDVEENSAAERAGIVPGDIIVKFDGDKISSYADLQEVLRYYAAGDTATVTVMRPEKGQYVQYDLSITLGRKPE